MSILVELAKYPVLETERLLLRPMTKDDLEDYYAFTSDDKNLHYAFFIPFYRRKLARTGSL
ncbi:GNAT family N-acetyltransferase [Streptococcus halotolerans]